MGDISFLPREEARARPSLSWRRFGTVLAFAGVIGLLAWYFVTEFAAYDAMQAELSALNATYEQIKSVQNLQKQVQESEQRLQDHERLISPYTTTVRIRSALEVLNGSVPEGMVLESFRIDTDRAVDIDGQAPRLTDVAKFIVALETSKMYSSTRAEFPTSFVAGATLPEPEPPAPAPGTTPGTTSSTTPGTAPGTAPGQTPGSDAGGATSDPPLIRFQLRALLSKRGSG